ncbi:MAG: ectoine hydroxylase [Woeseia sp.]
MAQSAREQRTDHYPSRDADRPRMVPREDPVVYSEWSEGAPLSAEDTRAFDRDGFLVLRDIFEAAEIDALCSDATRMRTAAAATLDAETLIREPGSGAVRSVFKVHEQSEVFGRLASDARLAGVAQFLLNDEVYIHQSRMNYKPGFQGKEFYWHSDFETWHVEDGMPRMRALSMTVLLTENTLHNGPLMLMPGSHRHFVSCVGKTPDDHYKESLKKQEYGVPDDELLTRLAEDGGITAPTGPPGTVIVFDCNMMHGSASNITPFPRSNAFMVYNALSNRVQAPFGPERPRPEFIASRNSMTPVTPVAGSLMRSAA